MAKTVLIIDDDRTLVCGLSRYLENQGFHTAAAFNGFEGLMKAREIQPDLITLDVVMPELNGYSLCGFLRTDARLYKVPIVMITSQQDEHGAVFYGRFAPDAFLVKPVPVDEIAARIQALI